LLSLVKLAAQPLGLIGRDKVVFHQQIGEASLIRVRCLLLLLPAEINLVLRGKTSVNDGLPVLGLGGCVFFNLRHNDKKLRHLSEPTRSNLIRSGWDGELDVQQPKSKNTPALTFCQEMPDFARRPPAPVRNDRKAFPGDKWLSRSLL
jgi:hypothetical protein